MKNVGGQLKKVRKRKVVKKKPRRKKVVPGAGAAGIQEEPEETYEDVQAEELYKRVVALTDRNGFVATSGGSLPKRSPFKQGLKMGRGAHFAPKFKAFIETGGVGAHKNCVVVNIRLNDLRDIDSANGDGTFKVSFFMDTAFWTPIWDEEHYGDPSTTGTFTKYEPVWQFPDVDVDGGCLSWNMRNAYFSKNPDCHQHETQLGQNYTTVVNAKTNVLQERVVGRSAAASAKRIVSVTDPGSHWPRMWRVCMDDHEVSAYRKMSKKEKKKIEPTNENPRTVNDRLKKFFTKLDRDREMNLSHPTEGIGFVTYEITCEHRNTFSLNEFPFDMHLLKIIVRLGCRDGDTMSRTLIPIGHDKGFFVSSRVQKMVDFHLARNLDWEVTKEPPSLGGFQRINAACIVRRKPGYFVRNYIVVIFLLTSTMFCAFMARPDDFATRVGIAFTVLLTVVAFKYGGGENIPQVSYATILDSYILINFYVVLLLSIVSFLFSMQCTMGGILNTSHITSDILCSTRPGHWYYMNWLPVYSPVAETICSVLLAGFWVGTNYWYWQKVYDRIQVNLKVINEVDIGWMIYKYKGRPGMKGCFDPETFIIRKSKLDSRGNPIEPGVWCCGLFGHKKELPTGPPKNLFELTAAAAKEKAKEGDPDANAAMIQSVFRRKQALNDMKKRKGGLGPAASLTNPGGYY